MNISYKNGRKFRTICETLRDIKTKSPEASDLVDEATIYAKKMDAKLREYKEQFGAKDYKKIIYDKPTKDVLEKREWYGILINYWELGLSKVIGRIQSASSLVIVVFTLLAVYNIKFGLETFIAFVVTLGILTTITGFIYKKKGLYDKEILRGVEINPYYKELLERVKKIESSVQANNNK